MQTKNRLETAQTARLVVDLASEKQASDILMLDMRGRFPLTDYFVIFSTGSNRQMHGLLDDVDEVMAKAGEHLHHIEGSPDGGWVLLDYGGVVIHVFSPEQRQHYDLDSLWSESGVVFRIQ